MYPVNNPAMATGRFRPSAPSMSTPWTCSTETDRSGSGFYYQEQHNYGYHQMLQNPAATIVSFLPLDLSTLTPWTGSTNPASHTSGVPPLVNMTPNLPWPVGPPSPTILPPYGLPPPSLPFGYFPQPLSNVYLPQPPMLCVRPIFYR